MVQNCHGNIRRKFCKKNFKAVIPCTRKMYLIVENCQERNINRNDLYSLFNCIESLINGCWCYENPSKVCKFAVHDFEFQRLNGKA